MKPSDLLRALKCGLFATICFNAYLVLLLHQYRDKAEPSKVLSYKGGEIKHHATAVSLSRSETTASEKPNFAKASANFPFSEQTGRYKASLVCDPFGGPSKERAAEMVYWRNIPSDQYFPGVSIAFSNSSASARPQKFLTFEPDQAGFNNIRLAFELAVVLAQAMGRTLVIPPKSTIWKMPGKAVCITDFFEFDLRGLHVVSFDSFLSQEALAGKLYDQNGKASYPPDNRTNWDGRIGVYGENDKRLWEWMRATAAMLDWTPDCVVVFSSDSALNVLPSILNGILREGKQEGGPEDLKYRGNPTPVNAPVMDRLREMLVGRNKICDYSEEMQDAKVIHLPGWDTNIPGKEETGHRLMVPFYALVLFEKWQADIRMKRLIRDHLRYADEIQCAAARIVNALRTTELENGRDGTFDSLHLRRQDFTTVFSLVSSKSDDILSEKYLKENRTVYVATDETNSSWFDPLRTFNHLYFLDNFTHLIEGVDPSLFGLIEQMVVARGDVFVGTYYSTFSAYVNRIRGYHSQAKRLSGFSHGIVNSEYIGPDNTYRRVMKTYHSLEAPYHWAREWPVSWRDIDHDIDLS